MKRFIGIVLGAIALVATFVIVSTTAALAAVCDSSAGYTMDDGACGYIHPDDRVFAVIRQIAELQYQVETLQIQLGFVVLLLFIIAAATTTIALAYLYRTFVNKDEDTEDEKSPELANS